MSLNNQVEKSVDVNHGIGLVINWSTLQIIAVVLDGLFRSETIDQWK